MLILSGCGSQPTVMPDPEIIEVEKRVRVQVPEGLLVPCEIEPLPVRGDTWHTVFSIMEQKDLEQRACNNRFEMIREWQNGESGSDINDGTD